VKYIDEELRDEGFGIPRSGVQITGISIPFWDLVAIMIKMAFAAIPAAIIIALVWGVIGMALMGFGST
jgi:hypothetical protein